MNFKGSVDFPVNKRPPTILRWWNNVTIVGRYVTSVNRAYADQGMNPGAQIYRFSMVNGDIIEIQSNNNPQVDVIETFIRSLGEEIYG